MQICMKFQSLFSGKKKKSAINLLSAKFAHRLVKVKSGLKAKFLFLFLVVNFGMRWSEMFMYPI